MTISDPKIASMVNHKFFLFLSLIILFSSCKRDDVDVVGPELTIASSDFKILSAFDASVNSVNFALDSVWFTAAFSERVSWKITIKGTQSKAIREISGISAELNKSNSIWSGTHSELYFFKPGEEVIAELTIFGRRETYTTSLLISGGKINYGSDVILWWDMNILGEARNGTVFWFDFYDTNEKIVGFMDATHTDNDPIQAEYRSIEGKDGLGPSNYFVGATSHTPRVPIGFPGASLEDVYLNFYVRQRTPTSGLGIELISTNASSVESILNYNVGQITWTEWQLVSIKLSTMTLRAGDPPFDPERITQIRLSMQIVTSPGVDQTGVDLDFINFTKGAPFNPAAYK